MNGWCSSGEKERWPKHTSLPLPLSRQHKLEPSVDLVGKAKPTIRAVHKPSISPTVYWSSHSYYPTLHRIHLTYTVNLYSSHQARQGMVRGDSMHSILHAAARKREGGWHMCVQTKVRRRLLFSSLHNYIHVCNTVEWTCGPAASTAANDALCWKAKVRHS